MPECNPGAVTSKPNASGGAVVLNHRAAGDGPVLVVLHGLFGNLDNFRSISLHLERHFHVLRLDLPGHGDSPTLDPFDFGPMADAVRRTVLDLDHARCHVLGHSLGGKVAMALTASPGELEIDRLVVVDIAPKHYPPHHQSIFDALTGLELDTLSDRKDADRRLREAIPEAGVRAFLLKNLERDGDDGFRWGFDLTGLARDYSKLSRAPSLDAVIDRPTLFIKGGDSDYIVADDEAIIRQHVRRPSFKEISGVGHWLHAEKPAVFTRLVQDFLCEDDSANDNAR